MASPAAEVDRSAAGVEPSPGVFIRKGCRPMHHRLIARLALALLCVLAVGLRPARPDEPKGKPSPETVVSPQEVRKAAERGLAFLQQDAAKWRKERQCATCHHGTLTVLALSE